MPRTNSTSGTHCLHGAIAVTLLWLQHLFICAGASESIYFDRYGHCQSTAPFNLADEAYVLEPVGGGFAHETLVCDVTFKAPHDYGICLTFDDFHIDDCRVRLKVYSSSQSSGEAWRTLDCRDDKPNQMCTSSRFVTVQVAKETLNSNKGYDFKIYVEKSNSVTEEGVLFASIGVFVAVILVVVLVIAIPGFLIVYCCCKRRKSATKKNSQSAEAASHENHNLVQPSAPPVDMEEHHWGPNPEHHLYPQLPGGPYLPPPEHPPPPYVPPPPYHEENPHVPQQSSAPELEESYPEKQQHVE